MRTTTRAFLVLTSLLLALSGGMNLYPAVLNVYAASNMVTLQGSSYAGWNGTNPGPTIYITQGQTITLNLISSDGRPHSFIMDVAKAGYTPTPDCSVDECSSRFTTSTTFTFSADMSAGTYAYYCGVHLAMMQGSIVVQAGSGSGSGTGSGSYGSPGSGSIGGTSGGSAYNMPSNIDPTTVIGIVLVLAIVATASIVLLWRRRKT